MSAKIGRSVGDVRCFQFNSVQTLAIFGLIVLAFISVAVRSERNTHEIKSIAEITETKLYYQCLTDVKNTQAINKLLDQIIISTRNSKVISNTDRQSRIAIYQSAKSTIPECGVEP